MKAVVPSQQPGVRLTEPGDEDERLNYVEMEPFTPEDFEKAFKDKKQKTFYVTTDLEEALKYLKETKNHCIDILTSNSLYLKFHVVVFFLIKGEGRPIKTHIVPIHF